MYVATDPDPDPAPDPTDPLAICFASVPTIGKTPHTDTWTNWPGALSQLNSVSVNYTVTYKNCNGFSIKSAMYQCDGRVSFQNVAFATTSLGVSSGWVTPQDVLTPGAVTLTSTNHVVSGTFTTPSSGLTTFMVNHGTSGVAQSKCFAIKCTDNTTYANMSYSSYDYVGSGRSGTGLDFFPRYHSQTVPLAPSPFTPSVSFEVEAFDANIGTFTLKFRYTGSNSSVIADMMAGNMYAKIHKRTLGPTPSTSVTNSTLHTSETTKVFSGTDLESSPMPPSFLFFWGTNGSYNYINNATIEGATMSSVKSIGNQLRLFNFVPICTEVQVSLS